MNRCIKIKNNSKINLCKESTSLLFPVLTYIKNSNNIEGYVYKDFLLGEYYTTISGNIINKEKKYFNNTLEEVLVIENDYKETTSTSTFINEEFNNLNKEEFLELLRIKKLDRIYNECNKDSKVLIINSIDNIYEYNNIFNIKDNKEYILDYINNIGKILNIDRIIILFRNSSEIGIDSFLNLIGLYSNIEIKLIPNNYIIDINDYIDIDNYILLSSIDIIEVINNCLYNKRLDNKYITIYNMEELSIKVLLVKKYMSIKEVLNNIDVNLNNMEVYYNGLYKGKCINNIELYLVDDYLSSLFIVPKSFIKDCINCGACNKVCPSNIDILKYNRSDNCINCGLCNYVCPSNINLRIKIYGDNNER